MQVFVANTYSGFIVAGGTGEITESSTGLLNSGFVFSGYDGYIFDQSGKFVGGYQPDVPINLSVHAKGDETFSYFLDGVMIANDYFTPTGIDYVEIDKRGASTLSIEHIF